MLNELEKRKPDFVEHDSVRVELADGGRWALPKPWLEVRPIFKDGVATRSRCLLAYGQPIDDLVGMIGGLDGFGEVACVVATLAGYLLRRNYELVDDELDELLAFMPDDVMSFAWISIVVDIATGRYGRRWGTGAANVAES